MSFVWYYKPLKSDPYCVRCVAGGDRLDYPDYTGLLAASLIETTLFLNSTIFDTKGIMIHIMRPQVFFLGPANGAIIVHMNKNRPFPPIHYTTIQSTWKVASYGHVYIKTKKGMYGFKKSSLFYTTIWQKCFSSC